MAPNVNEIRVRPATRGDIPALVACSNSATSEEEGVGFGRPRPDRTFSDATRLSETWREPNRVGAQEIHVAEREGRVVGYVALEDRDQELEIDDIEVHGDHQGRGVGSYLVRFVEHRAQREGKLAVTLGTSRNAAGTPWKSFGWWKARGFHVTGEEENAWTRSVGAGVREIRMRKPLA